MHTPKADLGQRDYDPSALLNSLHRQTTQLARDVIERFITSAEAKKLHRTLLLTGLLTLGLMLFFAAVLIGQLASEGGRGLLLLLSKILNFDTRFLCTVCIHLVTAVRDATATGSEYILRLLPVGFTGIALIVPVIAVVLIGKQMQRHDAVTHAIALSIYRLTYDQFAHCDHCTHKHLCPMHSLDEMEKAHAQCRDRDIDLARWQHEAHAYFRKYPEAIAPSTKPVDIAQKSSNGKASTPDKTSQTNASEVQDAA